MRRTVTVDANFHADHIRMCQPDLDIMLMDGQEGYMVEKVRFKEYLSVAKEMHGVSLDQCIGFCFSFDFFKPEAILSEPPSC